MKPPRCGSARPQLPIQRGSGLCLQLSDLVQQAVSKIHGLRLEHHPPAFHGTPLSALRGVGLLLRRLLPAQLGGWALLQVRHARQRVRRPGGPEAPPVRALRALRGARPRRGAEAALDFLRDEGAQLQRELGEVTLELGLEEPKELRGLAERRLWEGVDGLEG